MSFQYPVFLDLDSRPCLVIGGGPEVHSRIDALLDACARVTVIAAEEDPRLSTLSAGGSITWHRRTCAPGDLQGFFLAIAVNRDAALNAALAREAREHGVLFNAVDDPSHCAFIFPSVHRQGDLSVAVSTNGKCPALAARLRREIGATLGPEYARFLELAAAIRHRAAGRPGFWQALLDSEALRLLAAGRSEEAAALAEQILAEDQVHG
jgi:siroheme synthase-like protein